TFHLDRYNDFRFDEAVAAYDLRRNTRHSIPREQQRLPEIFGYASLYGWSEDKARQATRPEGQNFPAYLRARGFSLD
ncbi:MAG: NADPH-dependent oxidoreductase, partial [Alphaproteobacteria bacterium]|nr:NADPH-dependent oxidoreductase [Alphaproteobacteria bacterium]